MKDKLEVFQLFVQFYNTIQTQFGKTIKRLHFDNGKKYVNQQFSNFVKEHGIIHELTCVDTP